jgi:hypothetical protein
MSITFNPKFSFYLKVALMGLAFAIVIFTSNSKLSNQYFAFLGLATLLYGIIGHALDTFLSAAFGERIKGLIVFLEFILLVGWLILLLGIISKFKL